MEWFHVTPVFLLPRILADGGLRCGADLEGADSPRRASSRFDDDRPVAGLSGQRPSDYVLLFRTRMSPLLDEKIRGTRIPGRGWNVYPHARLEFSALECLKLAGGQVYGSVGNIGRTLRLGACPSIAVYHSVAAVAEASVEEIMLAAGSLERRILPLSALRRITVFSLADQALVQHHLNLGTMKTKLVVALDLKDGRPRYPKYAESQEDGPGREFLRLTRELYEAIWNNNGDRQAALIDKLSEACFD
jgi:hypothetical protein